MYLLQLLIRKNIRHACIFIVHDGKFGEQPPPPKTKTTEFSRDCPGILGGDSVYVFFFCPTGNDRNRTHQLILATHPVPGESPTNLFMFMFYFGKCFNRSLVLHRGLARVLTSNPQNCRKKEKFLEKATFIFCARPWYAPNPGSKEI